MTGPGTRKQFESDVVKPRRRSLLRGDGSDADNAPKDKRPAGPSSHSDPGMGSPTPPLPPGVPHRSQAAFLTHPKIAGSFRDELGAARKADLVVPTGEEKADER